MVLGLKGFFFLVDTEAWNDGSCFAGSCWGTTVDG